MIFGSIGRCPACNKYQDRCICAAPAPCTECGGGQPDHYEGCIQRATPAVEPSAEKVDIKDAIEGAMHGVRVGGGSQKEFDDIVNAIVDAIAASRRTTGDVIYQVWSDYTEAWFDVDATSYEGDPNAKRRTVYLAAPVSAGQAGQVATLQAKPSAWAVGLELFHTLEQAERNIRNPDIQPVPLYAAQPTESAAPERSDTPALDAARLRWLIEDHDDAEVRELARSLASRLGTSSYFAITRDIDLAMARIDGDKPGAQENGV